MNMINIDDTIAKQQIIALLDDKVMSQQDVIKYLNVNRQTLQQAMNAGNLEPLYVFNFESTRKIKLFYRADVEEYKIKLDGYRALREK